MTAEQRRLATFMFTDMVGYSALAQQNDTLAADLLAEHRRTLRPIFATHNGQELDAVGDGFLVEFPSAVDAARCAVAIQQQLHDRNTGAPADRRIQVRIGLHLGDVVVRDGRAQGDGVNIAARIEPLAAAGGICLSEDVARQIRNRIDLPLRKLGRGELKNIRLPVDIYRLVLPWEHGRFPLSERLAFIVRRRQVRHALLTVGVVLAVVALAGAYAWQRAGKAGGVANNRIAVLPFASLSPDVGDEYFADGITEELISRLARISGLEVIARTSVMTYKGKSKNIAEIGRELNVGTVLEGSVRKAGDKLRITAQLISVENEAHLWSDDYDRDLKDVFAIQKDIAERVATGLTGPLGAAERRPMETQGTQNPEAYTLYLKGLYHQNKRTRQELERSLDYFARASERDPGYAQPVAGLAESYMRLGYYYVSPKDVYPRAKAAAEKAVDMDETLAEAHTALAIAKVYYERDWSGGEREFKRALALNPSYAWGHASYGLVLSAMERHDEAMAELTRAKELDPLSSTVIGARGSGFYFARQFDQVIKEYQEILELDRNNFFGHWGLCVGYRSTGSYSDAIAECRQWIELTGGLPLAHGGLGCAYAASGQRDRALLVLEGLKRNRQSSSIYPIALAWIFSCLRETDQALHWLERADEERAGNLVFLKAEPLYDGLRSDPRFAALVRRIGLTP